ncbi:MAG TPA: protein kinase [Bryobacteraceae bacterium]|nr:protein kinase [Bryobacteraceae bacterium]
MLTPERWRLAEEIFHEAVARVAAQRPAFVAAKCCGDEEILNEVLSLLEAESRGGGIDESLAAHIAADWAEGLSLGLAGRVVDGYCVKKLLGAGGMGEAYLAEDLSLGRPVVLKFLPRAFSDDSQQLRRFLEEARAASALNDPGVITVYGAGEFEGHRYIATEFIDGDTVRQRLAHGPLPVKTALDIAIQAAAAVGAAHKAGIIHRDIKPENVMIRRDGLVRIIDFGLAKPLGPGSGPPRDLTRAGQVLGSPGYMPPEQAAGASVDAHADVYSLTVVFYEMLTGILPSDRPGGTMSRDAEKRLSGEMLRVIRGGMATDPAKRYPDAIELRRQLERLRERASRRRLLRRWLPIAAALVLGIVFTAWRWWGTRHAGTEIRSLIVMPFENIGPADQAHLEEGMSDDIITRLSALPRLRVPPAAAIRPGEDPFHAARRLGVEAVLTGSVLRSGDRLRVTAQLSSAAGRNEIWAEHYDENFTSIFAIQDSIAARVAGNLAQQLTANDRRVLTRHPARNSSAYDLYLRARDQWAARTPASIRLSIRMYQRAIAIEPDFALAWAGLADSYNLAASGVSPAIRGPLARTAAQHALAIDPHSAEAHTAMAFALYKFEWKWDNADREFQRAIALNPHYALAHHWYGEFLKLTGWYAASEAEFRRAIEDDPFSIPIRYDFVLALIEAGRVPEARKVLEESRAIDPNAIRVAAAEARVLEAEGRPHEAMEAWFRSQLLSGVPEAEIDRLREDWRIGGERAVYEARLRALLASIKPGSPPGPFVATDAAELSARLHDRNRTMLWLKESADLKEDGALLLRTRLYAFLRNDPDFIALERRVGLLR